MTKSTVSTIGITGITLFVIAAIAGAFLIPGYSQVSEHISESYAIDTKYGFYLRLLGYIPSGILLLLFGFTASKHLPKNRTTSLAMKGIGLFYGGGTLLTGLFPCDAGCNKEMIDPSVAQLIHNLSALFTYVAVPFFVIALGASALKWKGTSLGKTILLCGIVALLFAVVFFAQLNSAYGGLYQRILEGSMLMAQLQTALYMKKSGL